MYKNYFKKAFVIVSVLVAGYSINQAQASESMSDLAKRNIEALSSGYAFVNKSTCFIYLIAAPDDNSLAVKATWCDDCSSYWAISAFESSTCSANGN